MGGKKSTKRAKKFSRKNTGGVQDKIVARKRYQAQTSRNLQARANKRQRKADAHQGGTPVARHAPTFAAPRPGSARFARAAPRYDESEAYANAKEKKKKTKGVAAMDVDSFLNGGFLDSDEEQLDEEDSEDPDSEDSDPEVDAHLALDSDPEADAADGEDDEDESQVHQKEMERLKKTDPDFYAFLQKNDSGLLAFQDSDDDTGSDAPPAGAAGPQPAMPGEGGSDGEANGERGMWDAASDSDDDLIDGQEYDEKQVLLTPKLVKSLEQAALRTRTLRGLKKLLQAPALQLPASHGYAR